MHSLTYSFNKSFLSIYYVPATETKEIRAPLAQGLQFWGRGGLGGRTDDGHLNKHIDNF